MSLMFNNIKQSTNLRWFILADVLFGTFMATLDSSIVNVALPTISTQLKAELSIVQWVVGKRFSLILREVSFLLSA
jgi:hypothetical protein